MHIGMVVGEASGDILGASLIRVLKQRFPSCTFSGIGGERMLAEGFNSLYPQDRLAVMGLIEPLKRLPELLNIRKQLFQYFVEQNVDVMIGIDSPDFNLTLEKKLREKHIKTVHYVSPSVWAWRQGRIKLIKKAVDLMLTLLPFEAAFYHQHNVPVCFVGHPLADEFPLDNNVDVERRSLISMVPACRFDKGKSTIACLPGSRRGEVERIGPVFWQAIAELLKNYPEINVIVPALNQDRYQQIKQQLVDYPELPITLIEGHSQQVMAAADCVLMASGTTTLEAMLLKKPMVVVYKKDVISFSIISRLLKVDYISLPNLLADQGLVPELLQDQAEPEKIAEALAYWLEHPNEVAQLQQQFTCLHQQLKCDASNKAADAILDLIQEQ